MAKSDEDIETQTREMNSNIKNFQESISSLTANAKSARELAEEYMKFKLTLQTTLENVITYINGQTTANTKTQSEIEKKLTAYKQLLVEYKSKIPLLQKEDFNNLSSEIEKIKSLLKEKESTKTNREKLLKEAESMVSELRKQNTTAEREPPKQQNASAAKVSVEQQVLDKNQRLQARKAATATQRSRGARDTAAARLSGDKPPSGFRDNPALPKPNKETEGRPAEGRPAGGRKKSKKTRKSRKRRKTRRR